MAELPEDLTGLMDELSNNACFVRTLLNLAHDKVHFYLSDQKLLGPYRDLLASHARELETLLVLAFRLLGEIEQDAEAVSESLYRTGAPA